MNWKVGFKIFTLLTALSATVFSIYLLNTQHANDFFSSLGLAPNSQTLNWCSDRLKKAEGLQSNWSVEEKDRQWILKKNDTTVVLDYLDIEKWLARYCVVKINPAAQEKILDLKLEPFARFLFNDGNKVLVYQKENTIFQVNEVTFTSDEMATAILNLRDLLKVQ